jgi:hypothetical protein
MIKISPTIQETARGTSICTDIDGQTDIRLNQLKKLTPWSWALLEKSPIVPLLKNFPAFYGNRRLTTVFTRAIHWSLSWARSPQSIPPHPIFLRSILILSTHLRLGLPSGLFPSGFPTNILYAFLHTAYSQKPFYSDSHGLKTRKSHISKSTFSQSHYLLIAHENVRMWDLMFSGRRLQKVLYFGLWRIAW